MNKSKKGIKAQHITEDGVLAWLKVKKNRLKFFKWVWFFWGEDTIPPELYLQPIWYRIFERSGKSYNYICECLKIEAALLQCHFRLIPNTLRAIHEKYWERVEKYAVKKAKDNWGNWPMLSPTETIKQLLGRGWVHEQDVEGGLDKSRIILYCHVAPLVWPKTFYQHMNALKKLRKVGIPGRTGTKLPKN